MSSVLPVGDGWFASRRSGDEIETARVIGFVMVDGQTPLAPIIREEADGRASTDQSWVVWSTIEVEPPESVIEALHAAGDAGDDVEEWIPRYAQAPVITEIAPGARR